MAAVSRGNKADRRIFADLRRLKAGIRNERIILRGDHQKWHADLCGDALGADALERWDNYPYQRHFVSGLMSRYARKQELLPHLYSTNGLPPIRTVRQFDDYIIAPRFGYRDAQDYYESVGAKRVAAQIRVPFLMITAQDDPFVPYASFQAAKISENPAIRFVAPRHGGHCGFISRHSGAERFWAEQRIVDFCDGLREGR